MGELGSDTERPEERRWVITRAWSHLGFAGRELMQLVDGPDVAGERVVPLLTLEQVGEQRDRLRAALEFYAERDNYLWSTGSPARRGRIQAEDQGQIARSALASLDREGS